MLAVFYEQGRLGRPDPAQAAAFYEKAFGTAYTDDRGCVHSSPIDRRHAQALRGGAGLRPAHARSARQGTGGFAGWRATIRVGALSARPEHAAVAALRILRGHGSQSRRHGRGSAAPAADRNQIYLALAGRIALWLAVAVTLFVGAVVLVRFVRRRLGYKNEASLYRSAFAAYDVVHGLVARFGLVAKA